MRLWLKEQHNVSFILYDKISSGVSEELRASKREREMGERPQRGVNVSRMAAHMANRGNDTQYTRATA